MTEEGWPGREHAEGLVGFRSSHKHRESNLKKKTATSKPSEKEKQRKKEGVML